MRFSIALLGLLVVGPAHAQQGSPGTPPAPSNEDCQMCHEDPGAQRADGSSIAVDPARFAKSVHGQVGLACTDCHADLAAVELPHAEKLADVACATCHEDAVAAYGKGVHAKARSEGRSGAATCTDCHGAHDILSSGDPDSPTYHLNLPNTCGRCHGDQALRAGIPGGNVFGQFHDSIHGHALERSGLLVAPSCASCHGAHDILDKTDPESRVSRAKVPGTCGSCHEGVRRIYDQSIHGQMMAAGNGKAPVCIDCHTTHAVQGAQGDAFRVRVVDAACGDCHEESLHTYRDTFHGQVTELGFAQVATCADCHGAHAQYPKADPRSLVSEANRLKTCQQCHPSANANFAQYDPHANAHDHERSALLYYSGRFMQLLLAGVFGFFGLHTGLWFTKSLKQVRAARTARPVRHEDKDEPQHS